MGAWALKLFCCDLDLDLIQELGQKCGLEELEEEHGRTRRPVSRGQRRQEEHRIWHLKSTGSEAAGVNYFPTLPEQDATAINYSLFERLCSHPERVRAYLDSTGKLSDLMSTLRQDARSASSARLRDPYYEGYQITMLGACAMTLGARLSVADREAMRTYYQDCGLMRDAVKQIEAALDPETGYSNGSPWNFGSLGLDENTMRGGAPREDQIFPGCGMANVWAPDHGRLREDRELARQAMHDIAYRRPSAADLAQTLASLLFNPYDNPITRISSTKADSRPQDFIKYTKRTAARYGRADPEASNDTTDTCDGCGQTESELGQQLRACARCASAKYCSRECQRSDWRMHKKCCATISRAFPAAVINQVAAATRQAN